MYTCMFVLYCILLYPSFQLRILNPCQGCSNHTFRPALTGSERSLVRSPQQEVNKMLMSAERCS